MVERVENKPQRGGRRRKREGREPESHIVNVSLSGCEELLPRSFSSSSWLTGQDRECLVSQEDFPDSEYYYIWLGYRAGNIFAFLEDYTRNIYCPSFLGGLQWSSSKKRVIKWMPRFLQDFRYSVSTKKAVM